MRKQKKAPVCNIFFPLQGARGENFAAIRKKGFTKPRSRGILLKCTGLPVRIRDLLGLRVIAALCRSFTGRRQSLHP